MRPAAAEIAISKTFLAMSTAMVTLLMGWAPFVTVRDWRLVAGVACCLVREESIPSLALELPLHERARLAERLLTSLDEDAAVEQAWAAEIDRRVAEYRAGRLTPLDGDAVLAEARPG
jgi:putative addiction module component (TIGR02574 family)